MGPCFYKGLKTADINSKHQYLTKNKIYSCINYQTKHTDVRIHADFHTPVNLLGFLECFWTDSQFVECPLFSYEIKNLNMQLMNFVLLFLNVMKGIRLDNQLQNVYSS